jgi:hypothetical protein
MADLCEIRIQSAFSSDGRRYGQSMLDIARIIKTEISYNLGDMRNIKLGEVFEAVVVPDSIDYMQTENDLFIQG